MAIKSKYHSKKVKVDGETFDSKKEYFRWRELQLLEKTGKIHNLRRQQRIELLPSQRIDGKVVERPCCYVADFTYEENGKKIVEDAKGYKTTEYIIKRKLLLWRHGIKIREV